MSGDVLDLQRLRPLVEIMAAERTKDAPHLFEDSVQEGLIAAWTAHGQRPGKAPTYYRAAARNGVTSVVRGRPMTGAPSRRGWQDAHDSAGPLMVSAGDNIGEFVIEPADVRAGDAFNGVDYKDSVRDAILTLDEDDQRLVYLRFWSDLDWSQVAARLGITKRAVEWRWQMTVRPMLKTYLEEVALVG